MTTPPIIWQHLTGARWFAGKGRFPEPGPSHALDWFVRTPQLAVRSELVEVVYPDQTRETYQLLLSYRDTIVPRAHLGTVVDSAPTGPGGQPLVHLHDALADPQALRALVDLLAAGGQGADWSATRARPADLSGPVRVFGGEQSNTSIMIGQTAIAKFFRRLEPGENLDIAVHQALGRAGVSAAATLFGWVSSEVDGERLDLAMVTALLPEARDGWQIATAAAAADQDFSDDAAQLGTALASIHQALRQTFPTATLASGELGAAMGRRLAAAAAEVPALAGLVPGLAARFARLGDHAVPGQRIHGDFHLGQTLLTRDGWRIIDFEGEPIKSMDERRAPDSPWRDVAGMLRSLAYATSACDDPGSAGAQAWLQSSSSAFLDAYTAGLGATPSSTDTELLQAYVADKAVYEVVYEARNRPDWVSIPLGALRALAG